MGEWSGFFDIRRRCSSLGVDKNDFEGNVLSYWGDSIWTFTYLTTSIFNTVVSFCFCTLELIAISPRNKPIVIFHRKLRGNITFRRSKMIGPHVDLQQDVVLLDNTGIWICLTLCHIFWIFCNHTQLIAAIKQWRNLQLVVVVKPIRWGW